ncbi:tetratricopeptide repeat protein [Thalassobacillus sp. B23F22_16]|uniref:tetratricopeptide repeat protein n=1 Tax=Thalassobacillus sp. B23F22_16 TaxID=3459513 RepID=UPI00373E01DF
MHIGNRIQIMRNNRKLTLKQTADTITSSSYLAKIEEGNYPPRPHVLQALERKFEVHPGFLTNYEQRDEDAEYILRLLLSNIVLHPDKAREVIEVIEENYFEYLSPISLEATYLCLKCAYYYKINDTKNAIDLYEGYIINYIDETELRSYPKLVRESFNYMMALKTFSENMIKESTYYMEMFVDSVEQGAMKAAVIYNIALLYGELNLHSKAIQFGLKAKFMFEYTKKYETLLCKTNNLLGVQHLYIEQYEEALQYLKQAELTAQKYEYNHLLADIYYNKGLVYKQLEDFKNAVDFLEKSINIDIEEESSSIWETYNTLMDIYLKTNQDLRAENLFAIVSKKEMFESNYIIYFVEFILKFTKDDEYLSKLFSAIECYEKSNNYSVLIDVYKTLGDHHFQEGNYKQSSMYYQKTLHATKKINFGGGV